LFKKHISIALEISFNKNAVIGYINIKLNEFYIKQIAVQFRKVFELNIINEKIFRFAKTYYFQPFITLIN